MRLALAGLLVVIACVVIVVVLDDGASDVRAEPAAARDRVGGAEREDDATLSVPERAPESDTRAALDDGAADGEDIGLFHDGHRAYLVREFLAGWQMLRGDEPPESATAEALELYEVAVMEMPRHLGTLAAEAADVRDRDRAAIAGNDPVALLERLNGGGLGPLPDLVADAGRFAELFEQRVGGEVVDGSTTGVESLVDGATLQFPAGVYTVRGLQRLHPFPRDLTIAGTGMDATLLVFESLDTRATLRSLVIQDCTVHVEGELVYPRRQPASARFERVRFTGFDTGAGGSNLFGGEGMAIHALDCRFEGGYGSSPGGGDLFDVRSDALLVRMDRCIVQEVELGARSLRSGATLHLENCELRDLTDYRPFDTDELANVTAIGCSITFFPRSEGAPRPPARDLNELFPDWRALAHRNR